MKTRVLKRDIARVLTDYQDLANRFFTNKLLRPSTIDEIKVLLEHRRAHCLMTETNPAYQLPILVSIEPTHNTALIDLDLSNALILDEYA